MYLMEAFPTPTVEFGALAPIFIVVGAACLGVLVEGFVPGRQRHRWQQVVTFVSLPAALIALGWNFQSGVGGKLVMGAVALDVPTYFMWGSLLVFGILSIMVMAERRVHDGATAFAASGAAVPGSAAEAEARAAKYEHTEIYPLALFSLTGMMVFCAANDLLTLFVAVEVFSLPLYILTGLSRRRRLLSQEAALKYFMLGSLSSAFFLFGVAMLYGYAGSFEFSAISDAIAGPKYGHSLLVAGVVLMAVGLLFKVGVVPFHSWTPDVYQGAPSPVTGFMAICTKLAAVGATMRVYFVALGGERWTWQPLFAVLAVATMVVGILAALKQDDMKRLLAYSSIAHAGFIMTAITGAHAFAPQGLTTAISAVLIYLIAYGFATVGAFAIVTMVRTDAGEANAIASYSGLAKKSPALATYLAIFMLSFAGIPLTAGFIGKWAVFAAAWAGGFWWLVVLSVVLSVVAAVFYLRVIIVMFAGEPTEGVFVGRASLWTWIPIVVGAVATILLGVWPRFLMDIEAFATLVFIR